MQARYGNTQYCSVDTMHCTVRCDRTCGVGLPFGARLLHNKLLGPHCWRWSQRHAIRLHPTCILQRVSTYRLGLLMYVDAGTATQICIRTGARQIMSELMWAMHAAMPLFGWTRANCVVCISRGWLQPGRVPPWTSLNWAMRWGHNAQCG